MARPPKLPKPPRIRLNPLAKPLATPKFRPRVVKRIGTYQRKPKHPPLADGES